MKQPDFLLIHIQCSMLYHYNYGDIRKIMEKYTKYGELRKIRIIGIFHIFPLFSVFSILVIWIISIFRIFPFISVFSILAVWIVHIFRIFLYIAWGDDHGWCDLIETLIFAPHNSCMIRKQPGWEALQLLIPLYNTIKQTVRLKHMYNSQYRFSTTCAKNSFKR